jgi:hypothetical protein
MHPLQIVAIVFMVIYASILAAAGLMALYLAFFGDSIKPKPDSRLLRWPMAIKKGWDDFWYCVDVVTNGHKARRVIREMWASGS